MSHVFISYAHSDHTYARQLADHLIANGFDVWIDDRIDFGSRWVRSIFEALDSCSAFVLVMTPRSHDSEFVEKEYLRAADQKKPSFPLLLEGRSFPYFVGIQYYDVQGGKLPGQEFFEDLARFAPRSGTGHDITAPAAQKSQETPSKDATGEYLTATPQPANAVQAASPTADSASRPSRSNSWLIAAAAVIVAAIAIFALIRNEGNGGSPTSTPTLTLAAQAASATTAPSAEATDAPLTNTSVPTETPRTTETEVAPTATGELAATPFGGGHGQIAYTVQKGSASEIRVIDGSGGTPISLYSSGGMLRFSEWSPDGEQIAFTLYGDSSSQISIVNADGSNLHSLSNQLSIASDPRWSPDGEQLTLMSLRDEVGFEYFTIDADGTNLNYLTNLTADIAPDAFPSSPAVWSPDGAKIAFIATYSDAEESMAHLFVLDVDSSRLQEVGSGLGTVNGGFVFRWSPDSQRIVFVAEQEEFFAIDVVDADGGNSQRLTPDGTYNYHPTWSPDGSKIAFGSDRDGPPDLYVMNANGGSVRRLTNNPAGAYYPAWSPDGTQIAFQRNDENFNGDIYVMDAGGGSIMRLTSDPADEREPIWRP